MIGQLIYWLISVHLCVLRTNRRVGYFNNNCTQFIYWFLSKVGINVSNQNIVFDFSSFIPYFLLFTNGVFWRPLIFQTMKSNGSNRYKHKRFTPSGCNDIAIRKSGCKYIVIRRFEFMARTWTSFDKDIIY